LPTYVHINGGGAVDLAGYDHTFVDEEDLEKLINSGKFKKNENNFYDWKSCIEKYCDTIRTHHGN
jgi:hypothetical protein